MSSSTERQNIEQAFKTKCSSLPHCIKINILMYVDYPTTTLLYKLTSKEQMVDSLIGSSCNYLLLRILCDMHGGGGKRGEYEIQKKHEVSEEQVKQIMNILTKKQVAFMYKYMKDVYY